MGTIISLLAISGIFKKDDNLDILPPPPPFPEIGSEETKLEEAEKLLKRSIGRTQRYEYRDAQKVLADFDELLKYLPVKLKAHLEKMKAPITAGVNKLLAAMSRNGGNELRTKIQTAHDSLEKLSFRNRKFRRLKEN